MMDFKNKEIVFADQDSSVSKKISRMVELGQLRKIAPRLYTSNMVDSPEHIVRRHLLDILGWRIPGCLLTHKSAHLLRPTPEGDIYVTSTTQQIITTIPGITIHVLKGKGALDSDISLGQSGVHASSPYRWILEVLQPSRNRKGGESKSYPIAFVENWINRMIQSGGEPYINELRDKSRDVAEQLDMQPEFERLNQLISALLSTHDAAVLTTPAGRARAAGEPIDTSRIPLIEKLFDELNNQVFLPSWDKNSTESEFRLFSFFESYFSNYIEGTMFTIEEARSIVDSGITLPKRTADSHDILGTFQILSNRQEMSRVPQNEEEFIDLLRHRHSVLLAGRPDCSPGMFKTQDNMAGNTVFVPHDLVSGTLKYGFRYYKALQNPLARAIFMMFLCSEVHPFADGNGRVSRVMMNAELVAARQTRIIVPTVYREDYVFALRKLSRNGEPSPFIRVMTKLQQFSSNLWGDDFNALNAYLQASNAYNEPDMAKLKMIDRYFETKI